MEHCISWTNILLTGLNFLLTWFSAVLLGVCGVPNYQWVVHPPPKNNCIKIYIVMSVLEITEQPQTERSSCVPASKAESCTGITVYMTSP